MDENLKSIITKKIDQTMKALEKNNMAAFYCPTCRDAVQKAQELIRDGDTVTVGGSVTLMETGILEMLKSGGYRYLDRYAPGLTQEQRKEIFRGAFSADAYFTSANAVTEQGELYCVDGNGNRVSAMIFGPESVIVVAGYNKIVADFSAAEQRVREIAAPANAARLGLSNACVREGRCVDCKADGHICCTFTRFGRQMSYGRIKVLLVGEPLGY